VDIDGIRDKVVREEYEISFHAEKERYAEDITVSDLETAIGQGEILEDYAHDPRGPSCLVLGHSRGRAIHIVCGYGSRGQVRIITVYLPKPPKWINERTRRAGDKGDA
jgi:hypothetical protein